MTHYKTLKLEVPDDLDFGLLKLSRDQDGSIAFETDPVRCIAVKNGLDPAIFEAEDNAAELFIGWYVVHRKRGGAEDAVMEQILAEIKAEAHRSTRTVQ
jgi:hypothetical protein